MSDLQTLPMWAHKLGFSLDRARETVRHTPELSKLGVTLGASRLFTAAEAQAIAKAVAARAANKKGRGKGKGVAK